MRYGRIVSIGSTTRGDIRDGEIEVFPTGTTIEHAPHDLDLAEQLRHGAAAVRSGYERARDFHARPGPRPGEPVVAATSSRRGGDTDIVRPVLIDPIVASRLAVSGLLFVPALPRLVVHVDPSDASGSQFLAWDAELVDDAGRTTPATLQLLASPSMVVTVLELIPRRRLRWTGRRFVRDGVEALDALADRLVAFRAA